jgi:CHAD domain-containing protein
VRAFFEQAELQAPTPPAHGQSRSYPKTGGATMQCRAEFGAEMPSERCEPPRDTRIELALAEARTPWAGGQVWALEGHRYRERRRFVGRCRPKLVTCLALDPAKHSQPMAFKLTNQATLDVEIQRVLCEQIDGALAELEGSLENLDERIHECRQHLKRVRAVLRLIEPELGRGRFRKLDGAARSIAQGLAAARDSAALQESFDTLLKKIEPSAKAPFHERLAALSRRLFPVEQRAAAASDAVLAQREPLAALRSEMERLRLERTDFELVREGFRDSFARARRALARSDAEPTDERLHSLRTQAKRFQNQLALFEPLWPRVLRVQRAEITRMTEALGADHDLSLLEAKLRDAELDLELRAFLEEAVAARKAVLRERARKIAGRVFAESPKGLASRFARYYAVFCAAAAASVEADEDGGARPSDDQIQGAAENSV